MRPTRHLHVRRCGPTPLARCRAIAESTTALHSDRDSHIPEQPRPQRAGIGKARHGNAPTTVVENKEKFDDPKRRYRVNETTGETVTLIDLGEASEMTQGGDGGGSEDKRREYA